MRLLRLKIKNIASLQGEHEIDFQEIQKFSSLFAITGETGSGKSTILNCIGLALYGKLYKGFQAHLDVVTLGEKEGMIELIIQVKEKFYLADWRLKVKKPNGEAYATQQTPARNLYELSSGDFTSSKQICERSVTEILNLDFEQFCKCIILNQGEFSKFLQSSFPERKEILEKLYPGEVLEGMSKALFQEIELLKKEKSEIEIKLGEHSGQSVSGADLSTQKAQFEKELISSEETFSFFEKISYHFSSLSSYHVKYLEKESSKDSLKNEISLETSKLNDLRKSSEESSERFEVLRIKTDEERPRLQGFLAKEEALRNQTEQVTVLSKKLEDLVRNLQGQEKKIAEASLEEDKSRKLIESTKKLITLDLQELRAARDIFNDLFDLFSEKELISEEIRGKQEKLNDLVEVGKELKAQVEKLEASISQERTLQVEKEKKDLEERLQKKQKAIIQRTEVLKQQEVISSEEKKNLEKMAVLRLQIDTTKEEILPWETTLKLQEVIMATEVCVDHVISTQGSSCPVCEQVSQEVDWQKIKAKLASTNLSSLKTKYQEATEKINQNQQEESFLKKQTETLKTSLKEKEVLLQELHVLSNDPATEEQLETIKKEAWERALHLKDLELKKAELLKSREQYTRLKKECTDREELLTKKNETLARLQASHMGLLKKIDRDFIRDLKIEVKNLNTLLQAEGEESRILQTKAHLSETLSSLKKDQEKTDTEIKALTDKSLILKTELDSVLNGQKASELIKKIDQDLRLLSDEKNKKLEAQRTQEASLKNLQGRLSVLEDLLKDFDLHFTKELHALRELGAQKEDQLIQKLKVLDVNFQTPKALFESMSELIQSELTKYKENTNTLRTNLASVSTRLTEWERIQDKMRILEVKASEVTEILNRKNRLYEVLGKDELRTFVLALVEENLIYQTNEELQKLCQGRYEIIHQTKSMKMSPEFFILDKFREGGKRKISTLSGGETFMVSLAMALGLAEMTRGQAEIDSLFIDEGFGTLDENSLEDVLDMLKQIETRGLMVGVISHIKNLTSCIPVNLHLSKKQDGISQISMRLN